MNKIIYISIGAIWLILVAVVVMGVLVAPDLDKVGSLQKYKVIGQKYLDRREIDPSTVKINTVDDEFLVMYAKYMQAFQISENEYIASQRLFSVSLEAQNLSTAEQITAAYEKLASLAKQTQTSYDILVKAQTEAVATLKELKEKDLEIYGDVLDEVIFEIDTKETTFRDNITKYRLAVEKYYKAILDFVSQKQGAYQVQDNVIIFSLPEDQQYYDQLKLGQKNYEQELFKAFDDYQQAIRKSNSDIPVDIK